MATRISRPRIIVDCTHTFHTGAGTGIQRVVRHYADELLAIGGDAGYDVVPVRVAGSALVPLPTESGRVAFPRAASARESVEAAGPPASARARTLHALALAAQRATGSRSVANWLEAGPNEDGYLRRAAAISPAPHPNGAIAPADGDVLLSLDSSWVYDIRSALDGAGRAGATRVSVLCDVLPLTQPEFFTHGTRRWFRGWIEQLLPRLEGIVTISEATRTDLLRLVEEGRVRAQRVPTSIAVHLGAEITARAGAAPREELARLLGPGTPPALLTVGTLEPRKNVDFALDLFDALDQRGREFQWHMVGAPGWLADQTAARITAHPRFGRSLFWWTDLTDAELAWCYRHAAALVAVSKAEGFGLPLVEARLHGTPVLASDIPVFREVMGGEARYLPLSSAPLATAILEDFLAKADTSRATQAPSQVARSWRESTRELLQAIERIRAAR